MPSQYLKNILESILFVAGDAVDISDLSHALEIDREKIDAIAEEMICERTEAGSGIQIVRIDDKLQMCTNPDYMPYIDKVLQPVKKSRLSQSLLETLTIIAYKQPVTRFEIEQVRGVQSNYSIATLIEKGLIKRAGRKKTLGNPMLYATSDEFLRHFGISSLDDLPPLKKIDEAENLTDDEGIFCEAE